MPLILASSDISDGTPTRRCDLLNLTITHFEFILETNENSAKINQTSLKKFLSLLTV